MPSLTALLPCSRALPRHRARLLVHRLSLGRSCSFAVFGRQGGDSRRGSISFRHIPSASPFSYDKNNKKVPALSPFLRLFSLSQTPTATDYRLFPFRLDSPVASRPTFRQCFFFIGHTFPISRVVVPNSPVVITITPDLPMRTRPDKEHNEALRVATRPERECSVFQIEVSYASGSEACALSPSPSKYVHL